MIRTLVTLLVVAVVTCAVHLGLRVLPPQFPQANVGLMGVMIGLIAGGILRHQR